MRNIIATIVAFAMLSSVYGSSLFGLGNNKDHESEHEHHNPFDILPLIQQITSQVQSIIHPLNINGSAVLPSKNNTEPFEWDDDDEHEHEHQKFNVSALLIFFKNQTDLNNITHIFNANNLNEFVLNGVNGTQTIDLNGLINDFNKLNEAIEVLIKNDLISNLNPIFQSLANMTLPELSTSQFPSNFQLQNFDQSENINLKPQQQMQFQLAHKPFQYIQVPKLPSVSQDHSNRKD